MKPPARIRTTDAEIDAAIKRANANKKTSTRILAAHFDRSSDSVVVKLSTKATVIVPRAAIPGFKSIDPLQLADLSPQASGFSIWSEAADTGIRIERLLQIAAGPALTTLAAGILGRTSTPAKAAAARKNGRAGGRPAKKPAFA
jgi:hypothetical protein